MNANANANANKQSAWFSFTLSLAWGLVVSVGAYAVMRAVQHTLQHVAPNDPNPPAGGWSVHAGFFWRAWTVVYAGGMAGFIVKFALHRHAVLAARSLAPAIAVAAGLLLVQALFFP